MAVYVGNIFDNYTGTPPPVQAITPIACSGGAGPHITIAPALDGSFTFDGPDEFECEVISCKFEVEWAEDCNCGNSTHCHEFLVPNTDPNFESCIPPQIAVPCADWSCPSAPPIDPVTFCSTPIEFSMSSFSNLLNGNSGSPGPEQDIQDLIDELENQVSFMFGQDCILFQEIELNGRKARVYWNFGVVPGPEAELKLYDAQCRVTERIRFKGTCTGPYEPDSAYSLDSVGLLSTGSLFNLSETVSITINPSFPSGPC